MKHGLDNTTLADIKSIVSYLSPVLSSEATYFLAIP